MNISSKKENNILILNLIGRLDSSGSIDLQSKIKETLDDDIISIIFDMHEVSYLSSAGLRVILATQKNLAKRSGNIVLIRVQDYCKKVIEISGFLELFHIFDTYEKAHDYCMQTIVEKDLKNHWEHHKTIETAQATLHLIPGSKDKGMLNVIGHIEDILYARIKKDDIRDKQFRKTEYSIGLGGLGENVSDYFDIMGEMITIGGTMVWLPTDGNDMPDFLIPRTDVGQITLKTVFNVSVEGNFNEYMIIESKKEESLTIDELYRTLFSFARDNRPDFKGIIALAIKADMSSVYGSGVTKSPVKKFAPKNGEMITHESNIKEWFTIDSAPHHKDVTTLICGIGADLESDLSFYNKEELESVFYIHPANKEVKKELLHNHAVIFEKIPLSKKMLNLDEEIRQVVDNGNFIDMKHLLDNSTIKKAFIGISYIQKFNTENNIG